MATLTDFTPLEELTLPGLGKVDCSGLIVIVGPNSSGKSQLLRDIHQRISGEPRQLVVASSLNIRRLPYGPLIKYLTDEGFISSFEDDNGTPHIRPRTTYIGTGQHAGQIQTNQTHTWHTTHEAGTYSARRRRDEYLGYFYRFLVTALFLDHRLTSLNLTGMIDFSNQPPTHDLHALHLNDLAKAELLNEVRNSFSKAIWPDVSRGNGVCLRVSDNADISAEDRLSATKMADCRTIETEGDGLKSYVATCVALLLGRRPVCLVDEPEMCLHPPQAYNLGKFIGRFGSSRESTTFVATHSSHVLRGVIQTAPKLQIIRLTRLASAFSAHVVPSSTLEQALAKPTVRAESVLDGIFAQAVVVLEADGDRTVYQAAWESLNQEFRLDIHFAAVGGTGGIADTCGLYVTLRIPVAVIADLDIIADGDRLRRVLDSLACADTASLVAEAQRLIGLVKQLPPTISPKETRDQIIEVLPDDLDWAKEDDSPLRSRLQQIARRLDRMRRLKTGASDPLPDNIRAPLMGLVERLHSAGLFVVPVGELEEWLSTHNIKASKQNKWAWANESAQLIRKLDCQQDDVWKFMRGVGSYLQRRLSVVVNQ